MASITQLLFETSGPMHCIFHGDNTIKCEEVGGNLKKEAATACGWLQAPGFGKLRAVTASASPGQKVECKELMISFFQIMNTEVKKDPNKLNKFQHVDQEFAETVLGITKKFGNDKTKAPLNFFSSTEKEFNLIQSGVPTSDLVQCGSFSLASKSIVEVRKTVNSQVPCKVIRDFAEAVSSNFYSGYPSTVFPSNGRLKPTASSQKAFIREFFPVVIGSGEVS